MKLGNCAGKRVGWSWALGQPIGGLVGQCEWLSDWVAVNWTDRVVGGLEYATPLIPGWRSKMFILRPTGEQLGNSCTVLVRWNCDIAWGHLCPTENCIVVFCLVSNVWKWEQTAIISLYSIDWVDFVTETQCVYCAVRSTLYVLPTQCVCVFCLVLRTNSDYFTVHLWLVGFCNWDWHI
jgi:hypothetical protein